MATAKINTDHKRVVSEQNLETGEYWTVEKNFKGETCKVIEQFDRFVCLSVDGAAVDFSRSEVIMNPVDDLAELRKVKVWNQGGGRLN